MTRIYVIKDFSDSFMKEEEIEKKLLSEFGDTIDETDLLVKEFEEGSEEFDWLDNYLT